MILKVTLHSLIVLSGVSGGLVICCDRKIVVKNTELGVSSYVCLAVVDHASHNMATTLEHI